MKKLLMILALILALSLCFVSCGNYVDEDDENGGKEDAASKQAIIEAFASSGSVDSLIDNMKTEIDIEKTYAEIVKLQGEGSVDASLTADGETGTVGGYVGMKDGNIAVDLEASVDGETVGASAYGFFTEDLKYVMVVDDGYGGYDTQVMDFGSEIEAMLESLESMEGSGAGSMAGFISDFKLPALSDSKISYEDGKYVISKAYWKEVVTYSVDSLVDSMKDSGAEVETEEIEKIKEMANDVIDAITLDIFFRMQGDKFVGFGCNIKVTSAALKKLDEKHELGIGDETFDLSVSFDSKTRGDYVEYVEFSAKVEAADSVGMDVSARMESIFDNESKIAGFKLVEKADITTAYYDYSYDDYGYPVGEEKVVQTVKCNCEALLDLTKTDKAGSDVLKLTLDVESVSDGVEVADVDVSASVKALGNNKFDFSFSANGEGDVISASGSFEYNENAANFPAIPAGAIAAKDEALDNYNYGYEYPDYGY